MKFVPRLPVIILKMAFLLMVIFSSSCVLSLSLDTSRNPSPSGSPGELQAIFLGQDGGSFAGRLCSSGTTSDNAHIHLTGLRLNSEPVAIRVEDFANGGLWANPCDPVSNWFLFVKPVVNGETDIFFKPFRDSPEGTEYKITITYNDGVTQMVIVHGSRIKP